ncbi:hypothetical protein ABT382_28815 [Streptomyces pharetrae]|uniref:hypothetical protein n=1 Tax=Streptomyces pharetrae TaxID=291370 RepID=UPI003345C4D6
MGVWPGRRGPSVAVVVADRLLAAGRQPGGEGADHSLLPRRALGQPVEQPAGR